MQNLAEMLDALDLETWAENEGLTFRISMGHSGRQMNMQECPHCGDRRYRVYVNADTGFGNCFVCGETYTKWTLLGKVTGLVRGALLRYLSDQLKNQGWRPKRTITAAVDDTPVELPRSFKLPTPDGQNLVYLERRGVTGDLAEYFHLRYCEDGWWNFTREDGSKGGMNFGGRVLIPVYDLDGTLKTFQGRDVLGRDPQHKYLFPPRLPGTGRYLYNGQNAVRARRVVMGEGAFDVIALKAALDEDQDLRDIVPVGSFGKHLSYGKEDGDDQLGRFIQLKRDGLREVVICWDGEPKALLAAGEAAMRLASIGLVARVAQLPPGKDPNEVPGSQVRLAVRKAKVISQADLVRWRLANPYSVGRNHAHAEMLSL